MSADATLRGRVQLTAARGPIAQRQSLVALLASPPDYSGGAGGWEEVARPQQRPARWWSGQPSMSMSLELIIDRDTDPTPVEDRLLRLTAMGRRQGGQASPVPLRLAGDIRDPYTARGGLWVIVGMSLGERLFTRDGSLRRQHVTVDLVDFEAVAAIKAVSVRRTRATSAKPRRRTVTTRRGDTLRAIAVRELGVSGAWVKIRAWNKRFRGKKPVGPDEPLKPGIKVVIR